MDLTDSSIGRSPLWHCIQVLLLLLLLLLLLWTEADADSLSSCVTYAERTVTLTSDDRIWGILDVCIVALQKRSDVILVTRGKCTISINRAS